MFYELAMSVAYSFHINFIDNLLAPTATKVIIFLLIRSACLLTQIAGTLYIQDGGRGQGLRPTY